MRKNIGKILAMEEAQLGDGGEDTNIEGSRADNGLIETQENANEYEKISGDIDEAADISDTLMTMGQHIEEAGELNEHEAEAINVAVEHFCKRLGYQKSLKISFESYRSPKAATVAALEGIGDFVSGIWEAIKAAFKKMVDWVKGVWNSITNNKKNVKNTIEDAKKENKEAVATIGGPQADKLVGAINQAIKDASSGSPEAFEENLDDALNKKYELIVSTAPNWVIPEKQNFTIPEGQKKPKTDGKRLDNTVTRRINRALGKDGLKSFFRNQKGTDVFTSSEIQERFSDLGNKLKEVGAGEIISLINQTANKIKDGGKHVVKSMEVEIEYLLEHDEFENPQFSKSTEVSVINNLKKVTAVELPFDSNIVTDNAIEGVGGDFKLEAWPSLKNESSALELPLPSTVNTVLSIVDKLNSEGHEEAVIKAIDNMQKEKEKVFNDLFNVYKKYDSQLSKKEESHRRKILHYVQVQDSAMMRDIKMLISRAMVPAIYAQKLQTNMVKYCRTTSSLLANSPAAPSLGHTKQPGREVGPVGNRSVA